MAEQTYQDVVCVVGRTKDQKPIWKKVGVFTTTKSSGRAVILLDRTFNPAGVVVDQHNKTSVPLYFFEQDEKKDAKRDAKAAQQQNSFHDFEDDIPF